MKYPLRLAGLVVVLHATLSPVRAEKIAVPDWARPGSATHQQIPPPAGFHRPSVIIDQPIGVFDGQADVGGPLLPGSARYDATTHRYTISSASYNIWYFRDEFRYLWKKMSGDVALAAEIVFPDPAGYDDRKVVLIVRQDLDDNAKEIMAGLHGAGLIHLAHRPEKGDEIKEDARVEAPKAGAVTGGAAQPVRLGLEKRGDAFVLYVSQHGEPMHAIGQPVTFHVDGPFYVGIGFCSHVPDQMDSAVVSKVLLENVAGKVAD